MQGFKNCIKMGVDGYGTPTPQHLLTLKEVMLLVKGKMMVMVDKSADCLPQIYEVLKETDTFNDAIIFQLEQLPIDSIKLAFGPLLPRIKYIISLKEKDVNINTLKYYQQQQEQLHPYGFDLTFNKDNSPVFSIIDQVKKGSHVWATTLWLEGCVNHDDKLAIDAPGQTWGWIIDHGTDIIFTDRPAELIRHLRSKGLHQ